jgi:hypothetical protein
MFGRTGVTLVVAASAFWLSACGRLHEPEKSLPRQMNTASSGGVQQITLHVPGMIDRQGIT